MPSYDYYKKRLDNLKTAKSHLNNMYQVLAQYFLTRKNNFTTVEQQETFVNSGGIWDTTGIRSVRSFVSAVIGAIWKGEGRTFRLKPARFLPDTQEVREYFDYVSKRLSELIDAPPSNLVSVLHEAGEEFAVFGSGSVGVFETDSYFHPFNFKSWSIQHIYFDLGADGTIASIYYEIRITVREVVETYGKENVSNAVLAKYNGDKKEEKITIFESIEPRLDEERRDEDGVLYAGVRGMEYKGVVCELDEENILQEKGYEHLPLHIARCFVQPNEVYPRSLAMDALPSVLEINAHRETLVVGGENKAMPPVIVFDDGSLAGGIPDLGPRGMNVFNVSGQLGAANVPPIQPILTVGELQSIGNIIEQLKEEIAQHFLIDRLYDLNNKTRMTLGEAQLRYSIRNDSLAPIYTRLINEWISFVITDCFDIAFGKGLLGVGANDTAKQQLLRSKGIEPYIIPDVVLQSMLSGLDVYRIEYISPAAQILRSENYRGTIEMVNVIMSVGQTVPEALDRINPDSLVDALPDMTGGDMAVLNSIEEAEVIRQNRRELQQAQMQLEMQRVQSQSNQSNAQAQAALQGVQQNALQPQ